MTTQAAPIANPPLIQVQRSVAQTDPNDVEAVLSLLSTTDLKGMLKKANLGVPKNKADMVTRIAEYPGTVVKLNLAVSLN